MRFSVYNDPDSGWYGWLLTDGPENAYVKGGVQPTISECLTKIALARAEIARHFTGEPHPHPPDPAPYADFPELDSPHSNIHSTQ